MSETRLSCTAIVPTLHRPRQLEACLRSLRDAEPGFAAIIVADQGDTRELGPWVESLGARYLHLEQRGISRARNAALALASTPWCSFPDDDCTVAPDILDEVARALARRPAAGFVAGRVLTPEGRPVMAGMDTHERVLANPGDVLTTVMGPGLFVSARVLERVGGFDEHLGAGAEWPSGEDSDFLFRAFAAGESGLYTPNAIVTQADPFAVGDEAAQRRRARLDGRGWGALFAKHAAGPRGDEFERLRQLYELRAFGGAVLAALSLHPSRARRSWESWRGRREGWSSYRAREHAGRPRGAGSAASAGSAR